MFSGMREFIFDIKRLIDDHWFTENPSKKTAHRIGNLLFFRMVRNIIDGNLDEYIRLGGVIGDVRPPSRRMPVFSLSLE